MSHDLLMKVRFVCGAWVLGLCLTARRVCVDSLHSNQRGGHHHAASMPVRARGQVPHVWIEGRIDWSAVCCGWCTTAPC